MPRVQRAGAIGVLLACLGACEPSAINGIDSGLCMQADDEISHLLTTDPAFLELRACAEDRDCVLYQPLGLLWCAAPDRRACSAFATRSGNEEATRLRAYELRGEVCPSDVYCLAGSCPKRPAASCIAGICTVVFAGDGGTADAGQ